MTIARIPITRAAQLDTLDTDELLEGYRDGLDNEPEPGDNRSFSYWHGYRNGMADKGHEKTSAAQMQLASDAIRTGYFRQKAAQ